MHKRLRQAHSDMKYLGKAWRAGFYGPRENPATSDFIPAHARLWQQVYQGMRSLPLELEQERVYTIHAQWLRLANVDEPAAKLLRAAYRDSAEFPRRYVDRALNRFSLV